MFDYLNDVGSEIIIGQIDQPPHVFADAKDVFEKALEHEKIVTKSIFNILKNANEEGDFATVSFLQWFVNEQVEEEASASQLVTKIKMVCDNPSAMYLFDQELSQRVFVSERCLIIICLKLHEAALQIVICDSATIRFYPKLQYGRNSRKPFGQCECGHS
jgi:Ferritin-like protein